MLSSSFLVFSQWVIEFKQTQKPHFSNTSQKLKKINTTFNGGSLGSCIDEERCELRYVMRIAQLSESLNL